MIEIKKHGSYLGIDKNGFVIPLATVNLVQSKWKNLIDDVVRFYIAQFGNQLHSVYIRGSVAKGDAVDGISDLDSFAILNNDAEDLNLTASEHFQKSMNSKYPFCSHIEITFINKKFINRDFPPRKRSIWAELIKTQSICVYGENLAIEIESFILEDMIGHSYFIEKELEKLPKIFDEEKDKSKDIIDTCIWITRRILRSGFDLVMVREQRFTRDLYLCYESFSKYYPEKKMAMYAILNLSLNPTDNIHQINEKIKNIAPWLLDEIKVNQRK